MGSGKTISVLEAVWGVYDAAIAPQSTLLPSQKWILLLVPSFSQVPIWLQDINKGRDHKYPHVDTSERRYKRLSAHTKVLTIPLPLPNGQTIPENDWAHDHAIKIVFQKMTKPLALEGGLAKRWAKDYVAQKERHWIERLQPEVIAEESIRFPSLAVDYEKDDAYDLLTSHERKRLNEFQANSRRKILGGTARSGHPALELVGEYLRICIPYGGLTIIEEAHVIIDPAANNSTENTTAFWWTVAIENTRKCKIVEMTGTPGETLMALTNLINLVRNAGDERIMSSRLRESCQKKPTYDDDIVRKKLFQKASDAEEQYLENKFFSTREDGSVDWKPTMHYEWMHRHTGLISYITVQHDRTVYPQISMNFPQLDQLPIYVGSNRIAVEPLSDEQRAHRPIELFFEDGKQLKRVDPTLVLPYTADENDAMEQQDLGHIRPIEILVPLTVEGEQEMREKINADMSSSTRVRYTKAQACRNLEPPLRYERETDAEYELRRLLHEAECLDYFAPDMGSSVRKDIGFLPYRKSTPNKVRVIQQLLLLSPKRKVFVFAMIKTRSIFTAEKTVQQFLCTANSTSVPGFTPYEFINYDSMKRFIEEYRQVIESRGQLQQQGETKPGEAIPPIVWEKAIVSAWYQKNNTIKRRLISYKAPSSTTKVNPTADREEEQKQQLHKRATHHQQRRIGRRVADEDEDATSHDLRVTDELINSVLLRLFDNDANIDGEYIHAFVGDADSNVGLNLGGTGLVVLVEPVDPLSQQQGLARAFRFCGSAARPNIDDWGVVPIVLKSVFRDYVPGQELLEVKAATQEIKRTVISSAQQRSMITADATTMEHEIHGKGKRVPKKKGVVFRAVHTSDQVVARRKPIRAVDKALWAWQQASLDCLFFGQYSKIRGGCFPDMLQPKHEAPDGYCYVPAIQDPISGQQMTPEWKMHSVDLKQIAEERGLGVSRAGSLDDFKDLCHRVKGVMAVSNEYTRYDSLLWTAIQHFELLSTPPLIKQEASSTVNNVPLAQALQEMHKTTSSAYPDEEDDQSEEEEEEEHEANEKEEHEDNKYNINNDNLDHTNDDQTQPIHNHSNNNDNSNGNSEEEEDSEPDSDAEVPEDDESEAPRLFTTRPTTLNQPPIVSLQSEGSHPKTHWTNKVKGTVSSVADVFARFFGRKSSTVARLLVGGVVSLGATTTGGVYTTRDQLTSRQILERLLKQSPDHTELPTAAELGRILPEERALMRAILDLKRKATSSEQVQESDEQAKKFLLRQIRLKQRAAVKRTIEMLLSSTSDDVTQYSMEMSRELRNRDARHEQRLKEHQTRLLSEFDEAQSSTDIARAIDQHITKAFKTSA